MFVRRWHADRGMRDSSVVELLIADIQAITLVDDNLGMWACIF